MTVAAISDTHGRPGWSIPTCDVLAHAGDLTAGEGLDKVAVFAEMLRNAMAAPGAPGHAVIVPGNHDTCFETEESAIRQFFSPKVHVQLDEEVVLEGVRFYGFSGHRAS